MEARIRKKSEMIEKGCVVQGIGLLAPFVVGALAWPIGIAPIGIGIGVVMLIVLFIVGSGQSTKWVCSNCGTTLEDKSVKQCPGCHAQFEEKTGC